MQNKFEGVKQNWLEISRTIDKLLANPDDFSVQINEVHSWLKSHLGKIQMHQSENERLMIQNISDNANRKDSFFVCDKTFKIYNNCGIQNFFSNLDIEKNENLNLIDLVDQTHRPILQLALEKAIEENTDIELELAIKTNVAILDRCVLHIDMMASNPQNDRFVVSIKFKGVLASQLLEYQSLILDSLPGIDIYLFDNNYNYLFACGREKERFDLSNIEMFGKSVFDVLEKKAVRLIYPYLNKAMQGTVNEGEIRYNNEVYYLKATPVKNFKNETVAVILFSQNITNDKLLEQQLKRGREEALKADKLKSIFIANLSHEIRTPLNAIIGFSEQLDNTPLSNEQLKYNALIKKASDHLLYLVTEIVFLFKLGMGKVFIEKSPFSMADLLNEMYDFFLKQATEKNISFEIKFSDDFPEVVVGDSYRVRQILSNLLTNAIKYTDKGGVKMTCTIKRDYKRRHDLQFSVSDTGIGIGRTYLRKIFDVFEQGNKFNVDFRSGAGLGLGICKRLTGLLNGKIFVTSKLKVGSAFTVILPFIKSTGKDALPKKEKQFILSEHNNLLAEKKILLADDDEHNLILSENILKRWKTDFMLVDNGKKAIDLLKRVKFDMVIVDIHMPGKNGLDVARFLHNNGNINSDTPIFFITANAFHNDIQNYLKEGFNGYLIKPFKEADFYSKLCNILDVAHDAENQPTSNNNESQPHNFNVEELSKTARGDRAFFEKMINNFITNAENLQQGYEAAQLMKNWKELGEKTHKTITSFKYFGLFHVVSKLEKIEDYTLRNPDFESALLLMQKTSESIKNSINQAKTALIS